VQTERIALIPNGVPSRKSDFDRRAEHWPPVLGFVGLLRPRKGLEVLLEAARLLKERGTQFNLRIVGRYEDSTYERQTMALAERLGLSSLIEWRGFRREVDRELDCMSLLVFPSILPEGMPMVLLEAMAAGVTIVASDIEGVRGLLTHEDHALLIPPEDPEALSASIERLLQDAGLRGRLRRAAFDLQSDNYSDKSMAALVAEIYQQVVAAKRWQYA
jgi:glycosyltransferase involved in cell wall biosynthesis